MRMGGRLNYIDGLRGYAILMVIAVHASQRVTNLEFPFTEIAKAAQKRHDVSREIVTLRIEEKLNQCEIPGGSDGTRTRDLRRDRPTL
jgi:hypothetical protein